MIFEITRVNHNHQTVGPTLARLNPHDDIARHLFVRACWLKAVSAGEINQFSRTAIGQNQTACVTLNRDAGIIARFLARAGERIE